MLKNYKIILPYVKRYAGKYILGLLSLLFTSGIQLMIPQKIRESIDLLASGTFDLQALSSILLGMVAIALLVALGRFWWRFWIQGAARRIEADLRLDLFNAHLKLDASYFGKQTVGNLMSHYTNDLGAVRMACSMALVAATDGIFMTVSILTILLSQNAVLTLISIAPLPLITVLILALGGITGRLSKKVQDSFGELSRQTQETFSGIRIIKSYVKEPWFATRYQKANKESAKNNLALAKVWSLFYPLVAFFSGLTSVLLLRFGGEAVIKGDFSTGEFVASLSYLQMLIWPMLGAGFTVNLIQRGAASLERINTVFNTKPSMVDPEQGLPFDWQANAVELRQLSHQYPDTIRPALKDLTLTLKRGQTLAITGPVASGKSTLVKLLPRLMDATSGSVIIHGRDVKTLKLAQLRSLVSVVSQETFLFSDTIKNNIAFGNDLANDEQLQRAANWSTIDSDLAQLELGWETQIGERGINLSGGQKQRISISRALICDPEILILDDALSAVDALSEKMILDQLRELRHGKTTLIISHRIAALAHANQIIVLEDGAITQSGAHQELAKKEGYYRELLLWQETESRGAKQ